MEGRLGKERERKGERVCVGGVWGADSCSLFFLFYFESPCSLFFVIMEILYRSWKE